MESVTKRGGVRPGAGRPKSNETKQVRIDSVVYQMAVLLADFYDGVTPRAFIEQLIKDAYLNDDNFHNNMIAFFNDDNSVSFKLRHDLDDYNQMVSDSIDL